MFACLYKCGSKSRDTAQYRCMELVNVWMHSMRYITYVHGWNEVLAHTRLAFLLTESTLCLRRYF